ncbi:hypothetical protein ABIE27_000766 [Paenibacillus sp. 4624]
MGRIILTTKGGYVGFHLQVHLCYVSVCIFICQHIHNKKGGIDLYEKVI